MIHISEGAGIPRISDEGGIYKIRPQAIDTKNYIISLFMVQALHASAEVIDRLFSGLQVCRGRQH